MRIAHTDRDDGCNLACVGEESVGAEGVLVVVGDLSFKCLNFLFELLICVSKSVGFKAIDGIPMLEGGNKPLCNVSGMFGGDVLGKNVDCWLRGDGWRNSCTIW